MSVVESVLVDPGVRREVRERGPVPGGAAPRDPRGDRRRWLALPVLVLPVVLVAADATVLSFALPEISRRLHPSGTQLLWIVDVYSFVLAGLLIPMGSLGDRIGRRRLLLGGLVVFGLASALAAWSAGAGQLVAARALLGVGGATLMPATLALLRDVFPDPRERRTAVAGWSAAWAGGAALGPVLGGWLLEHFWWGSVFLLNVPVAALAVVLGALLLPESRRTGSGRIDVPSVVLVMAATLGLAQAVKMLAGGAGAGPAAAVGTAAVAAGVLFVRRQRRLAHPLVDLALFDDRRFGGALGVNVVSVFGFAGATFFIAQYLQLVLGLSPLEAAWLLVPGLATVVLASYGAVRLTRRFSVAAVVAAGLVVEVAGYLLGTLLGVGGHGLLLAGMFLLIGAGAGLAETLTADVILSSAPAGGAGSASAISETGYELGGAMGTAVLGSLLTAWYARGLDGALDGVPGIGAADRAAAEQTLGGALDVAARLPGGTAGSPAEVVTAVARDAFTAGAHVTSLAGAALLAAAATAVLVHRARARRARSARP